MSHSEIEAFIKMLLVKYNAEYALLFGSYARGDADASSDLDVVVCGGNKFRARDIFSFGEDLRELTGKNADVFELREVDPGTPFYEAVMREGIRIA